MNFLTYDLVCCHGSLVDHKKRIEDALFHTLLNTKVRLECIGLCNSFAIDSATR